MGPIIGRAAAALAKRVARKASEKESKRMTKNARDPKNSSQVQDADLADIAEKSPSYAEKYAEKQAFQAAKNNPAREVAEKAAEAAEESGVKVTRYPYVKPTPENMRRGGSVKSSASRRADGIASRGKTKGRFV